MKHKNPVPGGVELAKKYGKAKGYSGELGGWIWHDSGKGGPLAHGWNMFYHKYSRSILSWARGWLMDYYGYDKEMAMSFDASGLAFLMRGKRLNG